MNIYISLISFFFVINLFFIDFFIFPINFLIVPLYLKPKETEEDHEDDWWDEKGGNDEDFGCDAPSIDIWDLLELRF